MPDEAILLDVMGLRCPIPVQRVRTALRSTQSGQTILVIGDDPESLHDIPNMLEYYIIVVIQWILGSTEEDDEYSGLARDPETLSEPTPEAISELDRLIQKRSDQR